MADFRFTLKDGTGGNILSPFTQSTALPLDIASNGDLTYDTYTSDPIGEIIIEVQDSGAAPNEAPVVITPASGVIRIQDCDVTGDGLWGVTSVSSNVVTLVFSVAAVSSEDEYTYTFTSGVSAGGGVAPLVVPMRIKRATF